LNGPFPKPKQRYVSVRFHGINETFPFSGILQRKPLLFHYRNAQNYISNKQDLRRMHLGFRRSALDGRMDKLSETAQ
jgi:hypothetical protein